MLATISGIEVMLNISSIIRRGEETEVFGELTMVEDSARVEEGREMKRVVRQRGIIIFQFESWSD